MSQGSGYRPPPLPPSEHQPRGGAKDLWTKALGTGLSGVALLVAIAAIIIALLGRRNPLGKGMAGYDFSSPGAAVTSMAAIEANNDIAAKIELDNLRTHHFAVEKLKSLEIKKDMSSNGKKIVFIAYTKDGVKKHDTESVEKDADTGLWLPARYTGDADAREVLTARKKWEESAEADSPKTDAAAKVDGSK